MNPPEDTHFTRRKGKSSGVSLVWKKKLDYANPLASTSQQLEPVQEQSSDQERNAVSLSEPLDEFYPDLEPEDNLAWDHSGDLHSPPFGSTTSEAGDQSNLQEEGNSTRWSTAVSCRRTLHFSICLPLSASVQDSSQIICSDVQE